MTKFYAFLVAFLFFLVGLGKSAWTMPYCMSERESVLPFVEAAKLIVVKARVDEREGYFLFDTGISALTLNDHYFGGEENVRKFRKVTDVNGSREKLEGCFVQSFRWGGVERDSFHVPLVDLSMLEEVLDVELLGLLGWEVFKDVEVHIDYDARQMTLRRLDAAGVFQSPSLRPDPTHVMAFEMEGHVPVLQARIGEQQLRMGWDSGASINMMNKKLRRYLPDEARKLMNIPYGGVLSSRKAPFVAVGAIHVEEQFAVTAWRMALTKMKHFQKRDLNIDGFIGADLLRLGQLSINYRKREIAVWINDNIFSLRYQPLRGAGWARQGGPPSGSPEK